MTYVVAVSGGLDSMVLLDMLARSGQDKIIVAHFDHGIRTDSHKDAKFVGEVAARYGLFFETRREELGLQAGEALARERRYAFLHELTKQYDAQLVTAHHLDDLVETVAINVTRGTGWRGVAVLNAEIHRPLLGLCKDDLLTYAVQHDVRWSEDPTNATDAYLRNRLRKKTIKAPLDVKRQIHALQAQQRQLAKEIAREARQLIGAGPMYNRYFFIHVQPKVAVECLREITEGRLTRPQLSRALHAIKIAQSGSVFEAGVGINLHFTTRQFSL